MSPRFVRTDWPSFLDRFHSQRPGITEALLGRCRDEAGFDPYQWLAAAAPRGGTILDVACGSGPTRRLVDGSWIGVDRSMSELRRATENRDAAVVRADALELPLGTASVDHVMCTMALMLISPVEDALGEIRRVLAPGGTLHLLLPARRPLRSGDTWRYLRLYLALGSTARFPPSPLRRRPDLALARGGFAVTSTERRRFAYPIADSASAQRLIDALYLPGVPTARLDRAARVVDTWVGSAIGIALGHISARRT